MSTKTHEILLAGYQAIYEPAGILCLGTRESHGTEQLHLTLAEDWLGRAVTAVFTNHSSIEVVMHPDGTVPVPPEATAYATGPMQFGRIVFKGTDADSCRLTTDLYFTVEEHSAAEGENSISPTPDQYAQFVEAAGKISAAQVGQAVESYLAENPVESVSVDDTLTKTGMAADAGAVGNALAQLELIPGPQGETGPAGPQGPAGEKGADGNTSVKTMTKAEYAEWTSETAAQLYEDGIRLILLEDGYTNLVPKSTDANGNIYRGCGYRNGYRLTSSGTLSAQDNTCVSGFMPYTHGSVIRIVGSCDNTLANGGQYIGLYDENYQLIRMEYASDITAAWEPRSDGLWEMTIHTNAMSAWSQAKYFRVSCVMCVGSDLVITVNEPIGLEA